MNDELLMGLALFGGGSAGGGGGGTTNYNALSGRPMINGVLLVGDQSAEDLLLATKLQDFVDKNGIQDVEKAGPVRVKMTDTDAGKDAYVGTEEGIGTGNGTDGFQVLPDGTPVFTGDALKKWWAVLEAACVVTKEIPLSGWSANAVSINGTTYYTNTIALTEVYEEHPDVNIDTYGTDVLPTAAQRSAFKLVAATGYFKADKTGKTLTAYSQEKPTESFRVFIKGAK